MSSRHCALTYPPFRSVGRHSCPHTAYQYTLHRYVSLGPPPLRSTDSCSVPIKPYVRVDITKHDDSRRLRHSMTSTSFDLRHCHGMLLLTRTPSPLVFQTFYGSGKDHRPSLAVTDDERSWPPSAWTETRPCPALDRQTGWCSPRRQSRGRRPHRLPEPSTGDQPAVSERSSISSDG